MVCYARSAGMLTVLTVVALLVFGKPISHFLDIAVFMMVVVASAVAAVAAVLAFTVLMSVRRRRAAAGGCLNCRFRCQHAITSQPRRLWLVNISDREARVPDSKMRAQLPIKPVTARSAGDEDLDGSVRTSGRVPRWPDSPIYSHRAASQRARVGSSSD